MGHKKYVILIVQGIKSNRPIYAFLTALNNPDTLIAPLTKEPASGYPGVLVAISSLRLSMRGPSLGIGLLAFMLFRSAADPTRIPPLNRLPANDPMAATPADAIEPRALPIP